MKLIVLFFVMVFSSMANAGEFKHFSEWTPEQKAEFLLFTGVSYIDYSQTTWAMRNREYAEGRYYREMNPILGNHPSNESVAALSLLSLGYYYFLIGSESKCPKLSIMSRTAMISIKVAAVVHNDSLGISVSTAW